VSNLEKRVLKIEQDNQSNGLVIIAINDGEANEEAYQRFFANESIKPKLVIYALPLDVML